MKLVYRLKIDYQGKDNDGKARQEYLNRIEGMTDEALLAETETKIWLSAYANNNRRSDYHWHATACYDEWQSRGKGEQYTVAFKAAKESCGC